VISQSLTTGKLPTESGDSGAQGGDGKKTDEPTSETPDERNKGKIYRASCLVLDLNIR
jgi:hypothetical protein